MKNKSFKALTISKEGDAFNLSVEHHVIKELKTKQILVKVKYSCLNYKDVLVCNGIQVW